MPRLGGIGDGITDDTAAIQAGIDKPTAATTKPPALTKKQWDDWMEAAQELNIDAFNQAKDNLGLGKVGALKTSKEREDFQKEFQRITHGEAG